MKKVEKRDFQMHRKLLADVIMRQAGSIEKALTELVMNSIEAGATRVTVDVATTGLRVADDGRGFASKEDIVRCFEVFGQPHEESEKKVWAQFRMGRGQAFAFGSNTWRTGPFQMRVDIENGLDYELAENLKKVKGCDIRVDLYRQLTASEATWAVGNLSKAVEYVDIPVLVNGVQVNRLPSGQKWGEESTDDAWIKLGTGRGLKVYNLGVFVQELPESRFGITGIVVSKKQLKVNFARNDVISDCPVWRRLVKILDSRDATKMLVERRNLNKEQRYRLIDLVVSGEVLPGVVRDSPLFLDTTGHPWSVDSIANSEFPQWSSTEAGNRDADFLIQTKKCLVLDENIFSQFRAEPEQVLERGFPFKLTDCHNAPPRYVSFEKAAEQADRRYSLLPESEWTPTERVFVDVVQNMFRRLRSPWVRSPDDGGPGRTVSRRFQCDRREVKVGLSTAALAWTDGKSYIAFDRKHLAGWTMMSSHQGVKRLSHRPFFALGLTLAHEMCHDGDSTTQQHSPEFYQLYHELSMLVPEAVHDAVKTMTYESWKKQVENAGKWAEKAKRGRALRQGKPVAAMAS